MQLHAEEVCYPADSKLFLKEEKAVCLEKFDTAILLLKKYNLCIEARIVSVIIQC